MPTSIEKHADGYHLRGETRVARPRDEVFAFFSDVSNLRELTPDSYGFELVSDESMRMERGAEFEYELRIFGKTIHWKGRIIEWQPPEKFIDEQVRGPYTEWVHEHRFIKDGDHTIVRDHVRYRVPGGALVHWTIVRKGLEKLFSYRDRRLKEIFAD